MTLRKLAVLVAFLALVPVACGPLATFFAPRGAEIIVTHPGVPEVPATATSPTIPAQPAYTTIEYGGGGGQVLQEVGGFVPGWGTLLVVVGGLAQTAANIYLGIRASKGTTSEKVANAMVLGIAAAGDAAKVVRSMVQEKARDAGVSGPLETMVATIAPKKEGGPS